MALPISMISIAERTHCMRQILAQWIELHNNTCDEEAGPQVAQSIFIGQNHLTECKLPLSFSQTHPIFLVTLLWTYNTDTITENVQCNPPPPIIQTESKNTKQNISWTV